MSEEAIGTTSEARVKELEIVARWLKEYGSKHGMPDEVLAILRTVTTKS